MAEIFPASLQDKFNESGFRAGISEEPTLTTDVDAGPPKKRARYTESIDPLDGTINLEIDEWDTLKTFYKVTLAFGVKTFNYDDPFDGSTKEYQFRSAPTAIPLGGRYFRVTFNWREIP